MPVKIREVNFPTLAQDLLDRWRKVPVAVAVDIDPSSCQIDPDIRPLRLAGEQPNLFGRAITVQCAPPDFGAVLYASDLVAAGDVLVIAAGGNSDAAMIGEIVSGHVRRQGGVGVICDGAVRDVSELASWSDFAVFSRHITPRGPVSAEKGAVNVPVQFGGQQINPGDLILGDDDGLGRLTPEMMENFIEPAENKIELEHQWVERLKNGMSAEDVFALEKPSR